MPGGAVLPLAAVTRVGVRADRTRRGLATALMRAQLDDVRARGDAARAAVVHRGGIYGRFGFGVATRGAPSGSARPGWRCGPKRPRAGRSGVLDRPRSSPCSSAVHDSLALRRPGGITRPPGWWEV